MREQTRLDDAQRAARDVWRRESARLVGALTRLTRDVGVAEDLAQDALVAALEQWPSCGVPDNPAAWLMVVAKRRAIDHFRRAERLRRKVSELEDALGEQASSSVEAQFDYVDDDALRLIFLSCHPTLTPESRAALTLRLVGGLSTAEIARGFFVSESTMGQRISRAKKKLAVENATFEIPEGAERIKRLQDVMAVIYLIFNEGYTATAGDDWMRPDLANEAIRLARMLATLEPNEPEVLGLLALLEIQGSRMPARVDEDGTPVLLEAQNRTLWDGLQIRRGMRALEKADRLAEGGAPIGKYFLQAAIAAQHARAVRAEETDWRKIAELYDVLRRAAPGPIVEVNRAVAHGRAYGPEAGWAVLEQVDVDTFGDSPLFPSVAGDLFERAGMHARASEAFSEAASRTQNGGERRVLQDRAMRNRPPGTD
ncbi:MAG: sigma-70 family RNA polymerase sigma factor [Acidobacteriota bacterium]|nr:sigma-70 family RNA polymerase sigma factor [Acidobacteriota bacterium]